ncbi:penicillin-binding protein 1C [bacterium]|nr:penicillin-binding protein 1C [bacterium]
MRVNLRRWAKGLAGLSLTGAALFFAPPWPAELSDLKRSFNLRLLDRRGKLLRVVASADSGVQHRLSLDQISSVLIQATLASEDQRFYAHPGIDPISIGRAANRNWQAGRVVEGGSTLTQQLVRMLRPPSDRGWKVKMGESYWALRLERRYSKREILEAYLNLAPYGLQTCGVEAAAQLYFNKPASQLSLAESTFLAVLPRAPESFLPYQNADEIVVYQKGLLGRMVALGMISVQEQRRALAEPLRLRPLDSTWESGHFCDYLLTRLPPQSRGDIQTTLDLSLQHDVEGILAVHLKRLYSRGVSNGAVVVLDVASGEILAMVGSTDYQKGQFNACLSGRQAGSTLKPFTYALALERDYTAASILPDLNLYPSQLLKSFIPRNYDERFHGPVRLREALACSYNVPVVRVLERVGVESLLQRLRALGFGRLTQSAQFYGLGLTLGGGEVSLLELARAYRCLARHGRYGPERAWSEQPSAREKTVLDPPVAALITDILKDPQARAPAFGLHGPLNLAFECAAKTGTSKGYRDNWTVGYTPLYVVACWVGNFDGSSMRNGVSGVTGAAPVFHDVMSALVQRDGGSPAFTRPPGLRQWKVCEASGQRPGPNCPHPIQEWFLERKPQPETCSMHERFTLNGKEQVFCRYPPLYRAWALAQGIPQPPARASPTSTEVSIAFPDNGAVFRLDQNLRADYQRLHLRVTVPDWCTKVEWQVGETKLTSNQKPFDQWWPLQSGGYLVQAVAMGPGRQQSSPSIHIVVR